MATGWLAGQAARDFTATDESVLSGFDIENSEEFKTSKYFCKTHFDMDRIKQKEILLNRNFKRINREIENLIGELLGKQQGNDENKGQS